MVLVSVCKHFFHRVCFLCSRRIDVRVPVCAGLHDIRNFLCLFFEKHAETLRNAYWWLEQARFYLVQNENSECLFSLLMWNVDLERGYNACIFQTPPPSFCFSVLKTDAIFTNIAALSSFCWRLSFKKGFRA